MIVLEGEERERYMEIRNTRKQRSQADYERIENMTQNEKNMESKIMALAGEIGLDIAGMSVNRISTMIDEVFDDPMIGLGEHEKVAIKLRHFSGLTTTEVAQKLNCSQSHASQLSCGGIRKMQRSIRERKAVMDAIRENKPVPEQGEQQKSKPQEETHSQSVIAEKTTLVAKMETQTATSMETVSQNEAYQTGRADAFEAMFRYLLAMQMER